MSNKILNTQYDGTPAQICFRNSGDFNPTAANDLRESSPVPTYVQFDLTDVADDAYEESAKADLGANWAPEYGVRIAFEPAADPTTEGDALHFYWGGSHSSTAATANPAGLDGVGGTWVGYDAGAANDVCATQLQYIGSVEVADFNDADGVQIADVGVLRPKLRYGCLLMFNQSSAAMHSDAVEGHVVFDPIVPESQ